MKRHMLATLFAMASLFALPFASNAAINTYYVSPSGKDTNDGLSWGKAFATPNNGFSTINDSDNRGSELIIAPGKYQLTSAIGCNGGSSEAKRSHVRSSTGNPEDVVIYSDGTFECLRLGYYIQISGITFSNGVNRAGCAAGGIRFAGAKANNPGEHPGIVSNCIITCCQNIFGSGTNGAAVVMYYNDLLVDSVIRNNTATKWCGAGVLMVDYANANRTTGGPTMKGCRIEGNSAESNGAGVYVANYSAASMHDFSVTDVNIVDCEIIGNNAVNGAGLLCTTNMTVTMTGCVVSNNTATSNSGGLRLDGGCNLSMKDCLVSGNRAGSGVGADVIGRNNSLITTLSCSNTVFRGNVAAASGGGVRAYGTGMVSLDDCVVEANHAVTGGGVDIVPSGTSVPVLSCKDTVFCANVATNSGGAVRVHQYGSASFDGCRFDGNSTTSDSNANEYGGGAIFISGQTLATRGYCSVSNSVFASNTSNSRGGAMGGTWKTLNFGGSIVNCVFTNNASILQGGALAMRDDTSSANNPEPPIIRNCLFAFNETRNTTASVDSNGGAILLVTYSDITFENCTIVSNNVCNTGNYKSGGIHHRYGGKLKNCIVAFNTKCGAATDDSWALSNNAYINCCGYPAVSKFTAANGCIAADPKFVDPANGDFSLQASSPCRDKGVYADWMATAFDLLGKKRIVGDYVDIGCFEYCPIPGLMIIVR